jgi:hypothetical protein
VSIYHSSMYVTSALVHGCALLSCMLRYFNVCPPIVHAEIATPRLIVHACMNIYLSSMYPHCALLMYMNVRSLHGCFRCLDACPPIVHAYIATSPLIVHACISISLSDVYITSAVYTCKYMRTIIMLSCILTLLPALLSSTQRA